MIGASKILTVSYGTFSCTLEGFDDPFNTMRAIAEYFRDLAAEDRYFGAEPPTPDAAMLLKIAEREVQRRVEAKIQENGVVLRTGEAMEAPAFVPAPQPQAPVATPPAAQAPTPLVAPQANPAPAPMPDGVAAKLLRIRAAVTNAELAATRVEQPAAFAPSPPILAEYIEDQHADDFSASDAFVATFEDEPFATEIVDADVWDQPTEAAAEPDLTEPAVEVEAIAEVDADVVTEAEAEAEADFIAADQDASDAILDRMADMSSAPISPTEPDLASDTADDESLAAADADLADLVSHSVDAEDAEDTADADDADDEFAASDDDTFDEEMADADYVISAEDLADLQALDAEAVAAEAVEPAPLHPTVPAADDYDEDYEAVAESADAQIEDAFADIEDIAEQVAEPAVDPVLEEIDNAYAPVDEPVRGPSEKALRARARVLKVRRDDVVAADTVPAEASAEVAAMLADDLQDDLQSDLRALQVDTDTPNPNDVDDEAGSEDDARKRLDAAGEEAVSRLIDQTNEAMAVPENRRRLSAIAHLKAAVAATVADRFSKGGQAPKEADTARLDPYRDDLARVVRPQHPGTSDDTPPTPRPAPLVLVSAQRIDRPRTSPGDSTTQLSSVPVRPRRVTSAQVAVDPVVEIDDEEEDIDATNVFSDARGFAEFSERLGANSLAEILEAAAAYSVCIEGRPYFSRPQLMGQIGALSADSEYSREDGLRTFGAMLREGRIQKIKRGQFVLTESSHYLAEARKITG